MIDNFVRCVKSPLFVPNLPIRDNYDSVYFNAIKNDTLKEVSENKIVEKSGDVETTYNFDSNGEEVSCKSVSKDKSVESFYHDAESIYPTLKVIKSNRGIQAVRIDTKSLEGYCAKALYTKVDNASEDVQIRKDGTKNISKYRKNIIGEWQFDDYQKEYGASEKLEFWV